MTYSELLYGIEDIIKCIVLLLILVPLPTLVLLHLISLIFSTPKPLRKRVSEKWLEKIASGQKTHEGRLYRDEWEYVKSGDRLVLFSDTREVTVSVEEIQYYRNFEMAYSAHPETLLPSDDVKSSFDAIEVYREWYSDDELRECGVVVFKVAVVN
jgi:ASC-1-like (ASCH) protein